MLHALREAVMGHRTGPQSTRSQRTARSSAVHLGNRSSFGDTRSLQALKAQALRCHTPKQFHELLAQVRVFIPYEKFAGLWGYPSRTSLRFVFNHSFPVEFLRWHLTTGALWSSPVFKKWLRGKSAILWCDAAKSVKAQFDPELILRVKDAGLQFMLCGGFANHERFVLFTAAMPSAQIGRALLKRFETVLPWLVRASQKAYPRTLLTKRETAILERRAMGQIVKQIAGAEGISERTIWEHFQKIKKKLYTDDLVNAVAIAIKSGMVFGYGGKNSLERVTQDRSLR